MNVRSQQRRRTGRVMTALTWTAAIVAIIPLVTFGSYEFPRIPAVEGFGAFDVKTAVDFRLDGVFGANLLQLFRVTFAGHGERLWLESDVEPFTVRAADEASPAPAPTVVAPAPGGATP